MNTVDQVGNFELPKKSAELSLFFHADVSSNVIASPRILIEPQTVSVNLYQSVSLKCIATGNPQPAIMWYKDGWRIAGEGSPLLVIQETELSDRGVYHCTATNTLGTVSSGPAVININGMVCIPALR